MTILFLENEVIEMKRLLVIVLLSILAVATIFATISCKSVISGGPSGAPPKEPGHYIKIGRSFQKISDDDHRVNISLHPTPEEFAQKAILIPAGCTTIEYACRLTPTQTRDALTGGYLAQSSFGNIRILSMETISVSDSLIWAFGSKTHMETGRESVYASGAEDHSQYKDGDTYILLIFKLPASPEGKYVLLPYNQDGGWIALQWDQ